MTTRWTGYAAAMLLSVPLLAGSAAAQPTVQYVCGGDGPSFGATFRDNGDTLELRIAGLPPASLRSAISGSGTRYVGQGYEFHGKGDNAVLIQPGRPPVSCRTAAAPAGGGTAPAAGVAAPPPGGGPAAAAPPPSSGPSFNCAKARAASEIAICRNANLAELDRRMTSTYAWLRGQLRGRERRLLRKDQKSWLRQRNSCRGNVQCLESTYLERIAALQEWR